MQKIFLSLIIILQFQIVTAQVLVSQEPRHHPVFENEQVRILNVILPPGDTTLYHIHNTPSVFIPFTKTRTGSQKLDEAAGEGTSTAGAVWFENLSPPAIKIHRVWNLDTSDFHVIDVELLQRSAGKLGRPLRKNNLSIVIDTPWVRVYKLHLQKQELFESENLGSNYLLVGLQKSNVKLTGNKGTSDLHLQPGWFQWIRKGEFFSLLNTTNGNIGIILMELP